MDFFSAGEIIFPKIFLRGVGGYTNNYCCFFTTVLTKNGVVKSPGADKNTLYIKFLRGNFFKPCRTLSARRIYNCMLYETRTRSLVKTVIYRVWVLCTTYAMLVITGQSLDSALLPTIVINLIWMTSFYLYDRLWARISWGRINGQ